VHNLPKHPLAGEQQQRTLHQPEEAENSAEQHLHSPHYSEAMYRSHHIHMTPVEEGVVLDAVVVVVVVEVFDVLDPSLDDVRQLDVQRCSQRPRSGLTNLEVVLEKEDWCAIADLSEPYWRGKCR
jgi:hypothetical protein